MNDKKNTRVCIGAFSGAHGVKGEALIKTFTEAPENIAAYGPVETEDRARKFTLKIVRMHKPDVVIVTAPELESREDVLSLKGARLYVERDRLPPPDEDEYYLEDLVGLAAADENGNPMGRIGAVYNFGAGDVLELEDIPGVNGVRLVPFTKALVPEVDVAGGRIVILREAIEDDKTALHEEDA